MSNNLNTFQYFSKEHQLVILNTFKNFLIRDEGFSEAQAQEELQYLIINGKQVTKTYYTYYTTVQRRIGASKTLNRKDKLSVYLCFENAMNHAMNRAVFNV